MKKKLFILILLLSSLFVFVSCNKQVTDQEIVEADIAALTLEEGIITTPTIDFPTVGANGTTFSWRCSDYTLVTNTGIVLNPPVGAGSKTLTITTRAKYKTYETSCEFAVTIPEKTEGTIATSLELPFSNLTSEYEISESTLTTYYMKDGAVPYVAIEDFIAVLEGYMYSDEIEFIKKDDNQLELSYDVDYTDENDVITETVTYSALFDFLNNTISSDDLSFFNGYIMASATDYSQGLTYLGDEFEKGDSLLYDLSAYRLDMVIHEEKHIIPFYIANLIFCDGYFSVYYNGESYYSHDYHSSTTTALRTLKTSKLNGDDLPIDVAIHNYDFLAFALDHFYGLKDLNNIETYYKLLNTNRLITTDTRAVSKELFSFVHKTLDELHSSYTFPGYYEPNGFSQEITSLGQFGTRVNLFYDILYEVQDVLEAKWGSPDSAPDYRFVDNETAVITLNEFVTALADEPEGFDTNVYFQEQLENIFAESSLVKNIVVDLSYNTGGNIGALLRILGYITEKPLEMINIYPTEGYSKVTSFYEVDTVAYENVNWFFLISGVTFSAGNLMASIGKHMDIATIIGTKSSGGACSILPLFTPDGTAVLISSGNMSGYRVKNSDGTYTYYDIEYGVEPDYLLEVEYITDDAKIAEIVATANAAQ